MSLSLENTVVRVILCIIFLNDVKKRIFHRSIETNKHLLF